MANWKEDKVLVWIDVFSKPNSSFRGVGNRDDVLNWQPIKDEEREAFAALIAPENRLILKAWYAKFDRLEGRADLFRQILEHAIGERLLLGKRQ